jgi:hypothetical protein
MLFSCRHASLFFVPEVSRSWTSPSKLSPPSFCLDLADACSSFKSVTIPQRADPRLEKLAKRCDACKPLGMFRSNTDEFLLCSDEFGLYVDRHGVPSRSVAVVEWEGTAKRAAHHPPYVLLFDSRFIEVRDVETGQLAQIIPGNDVRCIWDGRGARIPPMPTPGAEAWGENQYDQEARVHAVMNAPDPEPQQPGVPRQARAAVQVQQVVELIPTIPLSVPSYLDRFRLSLTVRMTLLTRLSPL